MPHDNGKTNLQMAWLKNAISDLAIAQIELPEGGMYEQLCFHAQQAAEKSIKALLLHLGIDFPFTHNIQLLVSLLPLDIQSQPDFREAVILTSYAVLTRYPGELELVTIDRYNEAVQIASAVVELVEGYIKEQLDK